MTTQPVELRLLATAARLLLEYNDSPQEIERTLEATASAITQSPLTVNVSYRGIAVSLGERPPLVLHIRELRYNAALQAQVHSILAKLRRHELDSSQALRDLETAEARKLRHSCWLSVPALGLAAAALAMLLGADLVGVVVTGVATVTCPLQTRPRLERETVCGRKRRRTVDATRNEVYSGADHREAA